MNKRVKIILIFSIILLGLVITTFLANKSNVRLFRFGETTQSQVTDNFSYVLGNFPVDVVPVMVIIERADGMDTVKYMRNGQEIEINCEGRNRVAIDYEAKVNTNYEFKVISNGVESTETLNVSDDLDSYIEAKENLDNKTLQITTPSIIDTITRYYKITSSGNWQECNGDIYLDNVIDVNQLNSDNTVDIYATVIDIKGKEVTTKKKIDVSNKYKVSLNIFNHMEKLGKSMSEYGFSSSFYKTEGQSMASRDLFAAHWHGYSSFTGTFNLNCNFLNQKLKANLQDAELQVTFHWWCDLHSDLKCNTTIYYSDGTNNSNGMTCWFSEWDAHYNPLWVKSNYTVPIKKPTVTNMRFVIDGYDDDYSSVGGRIIDLNIRGIILTK